MRLCENQPLACFVHFKAQILIALIEQSVKVMPKKVEFQTTNELKINGIIGFVKRKVTPHGTGAKVTCPKEYLGKTSTGKGFSRKRSNFCFNNNTT
jgi:putative transposon-encoded protein